MAWQSREPIGTRATRIPREIPRDNVWFNSARNSETF